MEATTYLVISEASPVILQVQGRASFDNCAPVRDFFADRQASGATEFIIDLKNCRGMDSTFLGILAGLANNLSTLSGSVILTRPSDALINIIRNLGLDRLLHITPSLDTPASATTRPLPATSLSEIEQARLVLQAHENLIAANPNTRPNFLDVIEFLKERLNA